MHCYRTVIPFDRNIQGHRNVKILVGEKPMCWVKYTPPDWNRVNVFGKKMVPTSLYVLAALQYTEDWRMADKNYPLIIVTNTIATLSNKIGYLAPKSSLLILFQFLAYFVRYAIIKADFTTAIGRNPYWLPFLFWLISEFRSYFQKSNLKVN